MYKKEYNFYIYILSNRRNGSVYVGITENLLKRVLEYKMKINKDCFTAKYNINMLVHYEMYGYVQDAIVREKLLKKWQRKWKLELIEKENPTWRDLDYDMV